MKLATLNSYCVSGKISYEVASRKRASIKYVRTEGEGGSKNPKNMRTIVLIGCVKSVQEGGGGQKSRKICVRTFWMLP